MKDSVYGILQIALLSRINNQLNNLGQDNSDKIHVILDMEPFDNSSDSSGIGSKSMSEHLKKGNIDVSPRVSLMRDGSFKVSCNLFDDGYHMRMFSYDWATLLKKFNVSGDESVFSTFNGVGSICSTNTDESWTVDIFVNSEYTSDVVYINFYRHVDKDGKEVDWNSVSAKWYDSCTIKISLSQLFQSGIHIDDYYTHEKIDYEKYRIATTRPSEENPD